MPTRRSRATSSVATNCLPRSPVRFRARSSSWMRSRSLAGVRRYSAERGRRRRDVDIRRLTCFRQTEVKRTGTKIQIEFFRRSIESRRAAMNGAAQKILAENYRPAKLRRSGTLRCLNGFLKLLKSSATKEKKKSFYSGRKSRQVTGAETLVNYVIQSALVGGNSSFFVAGETLRLCWDENAEIELATGNENRLSPIALWR